MGLACCHGNRYDVISALKVLTNNRVAKIFIVCLLNEISFFGVFHRFTNTIATKKPLRASFNSGTRRHMWVEFVGSLLCTEGFFSGYSSFSFSSKANI